MKKEGYDEYMEGVITKDLTTLEQSGLGISIIHIIVTKLFEFNLHKHDHHSHTMSILKGQIEDVDSEKIYGKGSIIFTPSKTEHRFNYHPGSELIIVYIPSIKGQIM